MGRRGRSRWRRCPAAFRWWSRGGARGWPPGRARRGGAGRARRPRPGGAGGRNPRGDRLKLRIRTLEPSNAFRPGAPCPCAGNPLRSRASRGAPRGGPRPVLSSGGFMAIPRNAPPPIRRAARRLGAAALMALAGCARLSGQEPTPPGAGGPQLPTARFDSDSVRAGEQVILTLTFEDSDADVVEAYLVERVISDFRLVSTITVIPLNIRRHLGE